MIPDVKHNVGRIQQNCQGQCRSPVRSSTTLLISILTVACDTTNFYYLHYVDLFTRSVGSAHLATNISIHRAHCSV